MAWTARTGRAAWPPMTAARHAGYAAQWFALAGLLALLFGLYWLRARRAAAAA